MNLRTRVALGAAAIAVLTAGLHLVIGYASFSRLVEDDISREQTLLTRAIRGALTFENGKPRLRTTDLSWLDSGNPMGFRVKKGRVIFIEGGVFPQRRDANWAVSNAPLSNGFELEVADYVGEYRKAQARQLRAGAISLPFVVLLASLLGWWVAGGITRPIEKLADAAEELSSLKFPEPVLASAGNDELSRLAGSFNRMVFAVRDAFERERAFTRYASHELRTPLATMQAQLEAFAAGVTGKEKATAASLTALKQMRDILEGLLTLSREPRVALEPLPARAMLRQVLPEDPRAKERLRLDLPDEEAWLLGDEELLRRALRNLLDNALKYSSGEVRLKVREKDGKVIFEVRDFGEGVSAPQLDRLTDPFVRFNPNVAGSGLGLSLTRQAVEAMKGGLEFELARPGLLARLTLPAIGGEDA